MQTKCTLSCHIFHKHALSELCGDACTQIKPEGHSSAACIATAVNQMSDMTGHRTATRPHAQMLPENVKSLKVRSAGPVKETPSPHRADPEEKRQISMGCWG